MKMKLMGLRIALLAALALGGCDNGNNRVLQGWVEAELVFVSPDEQGRVEMLKVREGDQVKKGDLLFTVDDDLQKADVVVRNTTVINAQQSFDRAKELLKSAAGTQKNYDDAEAAMRQAKANLEWAKTRLERRNAYSPGRSHSRTDLLSSGRNRTRGKTGGGAAAARQSQDSFFRAAGDIASDQLR
jgi:HlyD family secretion protein